MFAEFWLPWATNLGRAFQMHTRHSSSSQYLLLFLGVASLVAVLLAGLYYWERRRTQKAVKKDTEYLLFRELCRIHQLGPADISFLERLAEEKELPHRSDVFVEPSLLDCDINRPAEEVSRSLRLRKRLFGLPDTPANHPAQSSS